MSRYIDMEEPGPKGYKPNKVGQVLFKNPDRGGLHNVHIGYVPPPFTAFVWTGNEWKKTGQKHIRFNGKTWSIPGYEGPDYSRGAQQSFNDKKANRLRAKEANKKKGKWDHLDKVKADPYSGAGDTDLSMIDEEVAGGVNLGPYGKPNFKRANAIVNSVIGEATKEYRNANADLAKQRLADLVRNARTQLAFDSGAQALRAGNNVNLQMSNQSNAALTAAQNAGRQDTADNQRAIAGELGGLSNLAIDAATDTADSLERQQSAQMGTNADNNFLNAIRATGQMGAIENARALHGSYRDAIDKNNKALAEIRARRPLTRLEVEKQIQDMFIANKLAEAQYGGASQDITNSKAQIGISKAQLKAQQRKEARENKVLDAKAQEAVNGILYGTPTKIKVPHVIDGKVVYTEDMQYSGGASDYQDAVNRLAAAGYKGAKYRKLAQAWWQNSVKNQQAGLSSQLNDSLSGIGLGSFLG